MNKTKKPLIKETEKNIKIKDVSKTNKDGGIHEVEEEDLPEDVQEALGIKRQTKAKIKEVDYISELENGLDDFGFEESTPKNNFEDEFDSDVD